MNPTVDGYFTAGCGRCALGNTPACKVNTWHAELKKLRTLVLASGLTEELKWGVPCYRLGTSNVVMIHAFKEYCGLSFFKGALLKDPVGILMAQTENVQATRQMRFTSVRDIAALASTIKAYIREAMDVEKAGLKVSFKTTADFVVPDELRAKFDAMPTLKQAFEALTPGRQRGYLLYFAAAKQSRTRESRILKCMPQILDGKGIHD